jgi:hypothetical protein
MGESYFAICSNFKELRVAKGSHFNFYARRLITSLRTCQTKTDSRCDHITEALTSPHLRSSIVLLRSCATELELRALIVHGTLPELLTRQVEDTWRQSPPPGTAVRVAIPRERFSSNGLYRKRWPQPYRAHSPRHGRGGHQRLSGSRASHNMNQRHFGSPRKRRALNMHTDRWLCVPGVGFQPSPRRTQTQHRIGISETLV